MIKNIKLAETKSLVKYLKKIDKNQYYSNFGPLYYDVKKKIFNYLSLKKKKIILTSSGHTALVSCLHKIKTLSKKKYVLIPSFGFYSNISAVIESGFEPIFIDVNINKMHTTEKELNEFFKVNSSIRKNIAGCLIVSPFGKPIKVELLNSLVEKFQFHLIYDAANTFLNLDKSIDKSNFFTICSFHPTKTLGANESGLIITDKKFYDYLKSIINFGIDDTKPLRDIKNIGFNGKFSEYDAAIFLANFKKKKFIEKKLSVLNKIIKKNLNYENLINKEDFNQNFLRNLLIIIPKINVDHFALNKQLKKYKVNLIKPWSHSLLSQFKIFSKFKKGNLKNSKILKEKMVTINLPYFLNEKKLKLIIKILNKFIS